MFNVSVGEYSLTVHHGPLPTIYGEYRRRAALAEEFNLDSADGEVSFVGVSAAGDWPSLIVAQRFDPCSNAGFHPGLLLVPETRVLLVGAGTRLLAYQLNGPKRLWIDDADTGFWGWARHGDFVLMSAELEFAAWDIHGKKQWTTFVEPPWSYRVIGHEIQLDVMGRVSRFSLEAGPKQF